MNDAADLVAPVEAWLAAHRTRLLDELFALLAAPSVSTDPAFAAGMANAATGLEQRLRRIGLDEVRRLEAGGHPALFASWLGAPGAPTILVYGHYDVQPPDPLDLWTTPPFEPTIIAVDGEPAVRARGASDDKGPLSVALAAIEGHLAVHGGLPLNVKILLEGEEEIGSRTLPTLMATHRDLLAADVLVSADGGRFRHGLSSINTSSRGIVGLDVTLRTAARDLHSGRFGGPAGNAALELARLLASLHDERHRIVVAGFLDGLRRPGNADLAGMAALDIDETAFLAEIGARPGALEPGVALLEALWFRPTIEINGIVSGYDGPGTKTVIPCEARAKITCRLGPGQDPIRAAEAVAAHLRAAAPAFVDLAIEGGAHGTPAYVAPQDEPFLTATMAVIEAVHGAPPGRVGGGGTLQISAMAREILGLETVMLSYATADERIHAPDEFFRLASWDDGVRAWARLLPALARATSHS